MRSHTCVGFFLGWNTEVFPWNPRAGGAAAPWQLPARRGTWLLSVFILQQQTQTGSHSAPCPEVKGCSIRWLQPQEAWTDRQTLSLWEPPGQQM